VRIGLGYDLHATTKGNKIFLGGIKIDCDYSVKAHSDGDVLLHSLIDALLGSVGMGDIGKLFPPEDERYKNISSVELLKIVLDKISKKIEKIINVDVVLNLEKPKLSPYQEKIRKNVAELLSLKENDVNIKIKSGEEIGVIGEKKAISCYTIVLVEEKNE